MDGDVTATGDLVNPWERRTWDGPSEMPLIMARTGLCSTHQPVTGCQHPRAGGGGACNASKAETSYGGNLPEEGPSCRCPGAQLEIPGSRSQEGTSSSSLKE